MILALRKYGFLQIGYLAYVDGWGISWGWKLRDRPRPGEWAYEHYGSGVILSRYAWLDYGIFAFWPIHFTRRTYGPYDPDVYNHETGEMKPYVSSGKWTGRNYSIDGFVAFGRYYAL